MDLKFLFSAVKITYIPLIYFEGNIILFSFKKVSLNKVMIGFSQCFVPMVAFVIELSHWGSKKYWTNWDKNMVVAAAAQGGREGGKMGGGMIYNKE